jgi:signal transduction histidine kinase
MSEGSGTDRGHVTAAPVAGHSVPELLGFLTGVSRRLSEATDYEGTLRAVAEQALPYLGSWCIVDLVEPGGALRRLAIVHPDPRLQGHAARLEGGWPPARDDPLGVPRAVTTRRTEIVSQVDDEVLVRVARNDQNLRDLRALGIGSVIVAPLLVRGHVLGAMTFVGAEGEWTYRDSDRHLAEDLAARCAIALESARLIEEVERARDLAVQANERLVLASLRERELADAAVAGRESTARLVASVSHEVRTPATAVLGYVSLLTEGGAGPINETQRKYLERIRLGARHLMDLLADLVDLEKIKEGRMRLEIGKVSLALTVSEALEMVGPMADTAGVSVGSDIPDPVFYMGDAERVRQILLNLLVNAVKFTEEGGQVRAASGVREGPPSGAPDAAQGPWAYVEVEDTGIGIPADRLSDIFDPFVQLGQGSGLSGGGAGLGLHISRDLARRMGGDLTVRSREGEGSCFTLWLPVA